MEFLAFLLALGAMFWAFKNYLAHRELEENQRLLQREFARLRDQLTRPATPAAEPKAAPVPPPAPPKEPTREKPPVLTPPPPRPPRPVEPPVAPPRAPQVQKPAFDWEGLVGVQLFSWIAGIALVLAAILQKFVLRGVHHRDTEGTERT
jgi:hypothetical protein